MTVLHRNHRGFHGNRPINVWILVGGACRPAVQDADVLTHAGTGADAPEKPPETRVDALYAIRIVPYCPDHGRRERRDALYARENEWYGRDYERDGPD